MTNQETLTSLLEDIGDSIRAKTGGSSTMTLSQMPTAVDGIRAYDPAIDQVIAHTYTGTYTNSGALAVADYAFYKNAALGGINVPNATSIGTQAFLECTGLTSAAGESALTIATNAFKGCSSLANASFPSVTSVDTYAFSGCSSLASALFPSVTSLGRNAFSGCSALTGIDLPNVTSIDVYAFSSCTHLASVSMPNVTSIGANAFDSCTSFPSEITFPSLQTVGAQAFKSSPAVRIHLPACTSVHYSAFNNLAQLEYIDLYSPTRTNTVACSADGTMLAGSSSTAVIYINDDLVEAQRQVVGFNRIPDRIKPHSEMPSS